MSRETAVTWDTSKWDTALARARQVIPVAALEALDRTGEDGVVEVKALAAVDTGTMRDSVRKTEARQNGGGFSVKILVGGPDYINPKSDGPCDYPVHVEVGTSRQRAQPFLRPGLYAAVGVVKGYFRSAFRRMMR